MMEKKQTIRFMGIILCVALAAGVASVSHNWLSHAYRPVSLGPGEEGPEKIRAILDFSKQPGAPSPWGTYPPSKLLTEDEAKQLGVVLPTTNLLDLTPEIRLSRDGVFVTQLSQKLFLSQAPKTADASWRLMIPPGLDGTIHVEATQVGAYPALGVHRPGAFTRVTWLTDRWLFVFADFSGSWGLDQLLLWARTMPQK